MVRFECILLVACFFLYLCSKTNDVFASVAFIKYHFTDFIAMPSLIALFNVICSALYQSTISGLRQALLATCACTIIWELAAPFFLTASVCDPIDVIAYFAGAFVFCILQQWHRSRFAARRSQEANASRNQDRFNRIGFRAVNRGERIASKPGRCNAVIQYIDHPTLLR